MSSKSLSWFFVLEIRFSTTDATKISPKQFARGREHNPSGLKKKKTTNAYFTVDGWPSLMFWWYLSIRRWNTLKSNRGRALSAYCRSPTKGTVSSTYVDTVIDSGLHQRSSSKSSVVKLTILFLSFSLMPFHPFISLSFLFYF